MQIRDVQRLLTAAGYYKGPIDGLTASALPAARTLVYRRASETTFKTAASDKRIIIAAGQLVLKHAGFTDVGAIDGYAGNLTNGALLAWDHQQKTGVPLVLDRTAVAPAIKTSFPAQSQCDSYYGVPGTKANTAQLKSYTLPVAMRIDYALNQVSRTVQLHAKCGPSAMAAMEQIVRHYGEARWRKLGLDRNAGTYNLRRMRGGSSWSMHAYGCAWDFYAAPNGLTTRCPQALFCGADYKAFFDIWAAHGWTSLGRAIGRDWMHVQAARL